MTGFLRILSAGLPLFHTLHDSGEFLAAQELLAMEGKRMSGDPEIQCPAFSVWQFDIAPAVCDFDAGFAGAVFPRIGVEQVNIDPAVFSSEDHSARICAPRAELLIPDGMLDDSSVEPDMEPAKRIRLRCAGELHGLQGALVLHDGVVGARSEFLGHNDGCSAPESVERSAWSKIQANAVACFKCR